MAFQRGEVWLVEYPFSDLSVTKVRPAVVMSDDAYHRVKPDLIIAPLTSRIPHTPNQFDYMLQDWSGAGLKKPSALKTAVATIDPTLALHKIGTLGATDLENVEDKLKLALGFQ